MASTWLNDWSLSCGPIRSKYSAGSVVIGEFYCTTVPFVFSIFQSIRLIFQIQYDLYGHSASLLQHQKKRSVVTQDWRSTSDYTRQ